ncbi:MAG TPA: phage tail tape measure protein, partial [Gemmatimonadales bacterium]|nr:phage tail tape measure protein [Gemmatimonadales bacterium]
MANTIDSMLIALGVSTDGLTRGLNQGLKEIQRFERQATKAAAGQTALPASLNQARLQKSLTGARQQIDSFTAQATAAMRDVGVIQAGRVARGARAAGQALVTNLTADVRRLEAQGVISPAFANRLVGQMRAAGRRAGRELSDALTDRLSQSSAALTSAGTALTVGLTAPIVGIGVASLKTATTFESAMAEVAKTANASGAELDRLGQAFRRLSLEAGRPDADSIAGLAALGAQLGVATPDLLGFTDVITKAAAAMDSMNAEDIATSFAQFRNVLGLSVKDTERFGSALAELADSGAATERGITEMGLRLAGTGKTVGLSAANVLAFATAISSAGVEAEAGGTAMSRTMQEIKKSVDGADARLATFAKVANKSVTEFVRLFKTDAASAITAFIEGLGRVAQQGGDLFGLLDTLKLDSARNADVLTRLAGAGQLFRNAIATGNDAFARGSRLQEEFERKANTTSERFKALGRNIADVARELGAALLPAFRTMIGTAQALIGPLRSLTQSFAALPPAGQLTVVALAAMVASIGPAVLAVGQLAGAIVNLRRAFLLLGLTGGLAGITSVLVGGGLLVALGALVAYLFRAGQAAAAARQQMDAFNQALTQMPVGALQQSQQELDRQIAALRTRKALLEAQTPALRTRAATDGLTLARSDLTLPRSKADTELEANQRAIRAAQAGIAALDAQRKAVAGQITQTVVAQRQADAQSVQTLAQLIAAGQASQQEIARAKASLAGYNAALAVGIKDEKLRLDILQRRNTLEEALKTAKAPKFTTGLSDDQLKALKASVDVARNKLDALRERALALKDPLARLQVVLDTAPALRAAGELRDKLQKALAQQPANSPAAAAVSGFVGDLAGAVRQAVDAGTQAIVESAQDAGSRLEVIRETQDGTTGAALRFVAAYGQAQRALEAVNGLITAQGGPLTADNSLLTVQLNLLRQIQAVREQTAEDRLRLVGGNEIAEFLKAARELQAAQDALTVAVAARDQSAAHQAEADLERLRKRITALRAAIVVALQARGLTA